MLQILQCHCMKDLFDAQLQKLIFSFVLWSDPFNALAKSRPWFCFMVVEEWETISCQNTQRALLPTFQPSRDINWLKTTCTKWKGSVLMPVKFCCSFSEFGDMMTLQKLKEVVERTGNILDRSHSYIGECWWSVPKKNDTKTLRVQHAEETLETIKPLDITSSSDEVFSRYGSVKQIRVDEANFCDSLCIFAILCSNSKVKQIWFSASRVVIWFSISTRRREPVLWSSSSNFQMLRTGAHHSSIVYIGLFIIVSFLMLLAYTVSVCISDMCLHSEFELDICDVLGIVSEILRESQRAVHFTRQPWTTWTGRCWVKGRGIYPWKYRSFL